jgi:hypothetical protein
MDKTREERERALSAAARRERAAWTVLERASRPDDAADQEYLRASRERWQAASQSLIEALEALKAVHS